MITFNFNNASKLPDAAVAGRNIAQAVGEGRVSLSEWAQEASITPEVLIGNDLINSVDPENMNAILQTLLAIYSAMYLKCFQLISPVGEDRRRISVRDLLEPLSTSQAIRYKETDLTGMVRKVIETLADFTLESYDGLDAGVLGREFKFIDLEDASSDYSKNVNLAVGRLIDVPISLGGKPSNVTVTCTLMPKFVENKLLQEILAAYVGKDQSYIGSYQRMRRGEVKSFMDYALGLEEIADDRALLMNDQEGVYQRIRQRKLNSSLTSVMSGKQNMNIASNMVVFSDTKRKDYEMAMRMKLARPEAREKFFETTGSLMLAVVNTVREQIIIYQRGVPLQAVLSFNDIKTAGKDPKAIDMNTILAEFKQNRSAIGAF